MWRWFNWFANVHVNDTIFSLFDNHFSDSRFATQTFAGFIDCYVRFPSPKWLGEHLKFPFGVIVLFLRWKKGGKRQKGWDLSEEFWSALCYVISKLKKRLSVYVCEGLKKEIHFRFKSYQATRKIRFVSFLFCVLYFTITTRHLIGSWEHLLFYLAEIDGDTAKSVSFLFSCFVSQNVKIASNAFSPWKKDLWFLIVSQCTSAI